MKFDLKQTVGGKPLTVARDLLRREESFTAARAAQFLDLTERDTETYLSALIEAGYVEQEREGVGFGRAGYFVPTRLGISLRKSRKTKRIPRSAADQAVDALLGAINQVNADPELITSVEEADLFGSYATGGDNLGDVDVAVLLKRRLADNDWVKASQERAAMTGRRMSFIDELTWGEEEVWRALRAASRHLDIQPKADILLVGCPMTPLFRASTP